MKLTMLAVVTLAVLLLAACGGGSDSDGGIASLADVETVEIVDPAGEAPDSASTEGVQAAPPVDEESEEPANAAEPEPSAPENREEALLALAQCLRDQGLQVDDPTFSGSGLRAEGFFRGNGIDRSKPDVQAALQECGSLLPGARGEFDPERQAERQDNQLALAQCLREQGLEVADPDFSAEPGPGRGGMLGQSGLDGNDPDVRAALEFCREEVGFGRRRGGGGLGGRGGDQ